MSIADIKARNYNLDIKNPHEVAAELGDPAELLAEYETQLRAIAELQAELKTALAEALTRS